MSSSPTEIPAKWIEVAVDTIAALPGHIEQSTVGRQLIGNNSAAAAGGPGFHFAMKLLATEPGANHGFLDQCQHET
jgi:hypothetical protein